MKNIPFESLVATAVLLILFPVIDLVGSEKNGNNALARNGKSEGVIVYRDEAMGNQTADGIMGMSSSKTIPGNWNSLSPTLSDMIRVPGSASTSTTSSRGNLQSLPSGQYHEMFQSSSSSSLSSSSSSLPGGNMYYKFPLSSSSTFLPRSSPERYARVTTTSPIFTSTASRSFSSSAIIGGAVSISVSNSNQLVSFSSAEIPLPLASSSRVTGPYFESNKTTIHISAKAGQNVVLDCAVILLQGRTVSWLRRGKDSLQLLTVGNTTYYSDSRLGLRFRYPNNWRLGIESVNKADEGEYQCQLSTHPPKVLIYQLKVIAPTVIILDENGHTVTERHYKVDSSLHLTCRASHVDKQAEKVVWLKGERVLPGGDSRIKVKVAKNEENGEITKFLSVLSLIAKDSGNFSCKYGPTRATVTIHVLTSELPAAVQHENCAHKMVAPGLQVVELLIFAGVFAIQFPLSMLFPLLSMSMSRSQSQAASAILL